MKRIVTLGMAAGDLWLAVAGQPLPKDARLIKDLGDAKMRLRRAVPPMAHPVILDAVADIAEALGYPLIGVSMSPSEIPNVLDWLVQAIFDHRLVAFTGSSLEGGGKGPNQQPGPQPNKETPAKKENQVKPKIEVEYKVVLVDKGLSKHQAAGETKLVTSPTYIELTVEETNTGNPFTKGATLKCSKADVKFYTDEKLTTELDIKKPLTNHQIEGAKLKLWLHAASPGEFDLTLDLEDPADGTIKRVHNPATQKMYAAQLDLELYSAKKDHSKVFADATAPTHTVLSDQDKVKKGRLLVVQDHDHHGRAKLVVKKPDAKLWSVGEATYEVIVAQSAISGAVKLFDKETGGTAKKDLGSGALHLKKGDLGADHTFWVEGGSETNDFRHVTIHLGLDRPAGGLAKTAKNFGDIARVTVVDIAEITPTADDKQYVNMPADAAKPRLGREIKSKVKLSKPLKDIEMMFALVPHVDKVDAKKSNPTDIPAAAKHTPAKDADAPGKTDATGVAESPKLKLSGFGGDKFKVVAYPKEAPPPGKGTPAKSLSKELTIWKKIFYTLTCMKRYDAATDYSDRLDEAGVQSKLADKYFVEFERTGSIHIKNFTSVVKDSQIATWNGANLPAVAARTINVGLVEAQTGDATTDDDRSWAASAVYDAASKVSTETLTGFTFDLSAQAQWLSSAQYENKDHPGTWNAIPNAKVSLALDGLKHKLKVDLTDIVGGASPVPVAKIKIKVTVKKLDEWSGDQSATGVLVGMRWREIAYPGKVKDAVRRTEMHEIGHYLGLCAKKLANTAEGANDRRYDQTGPHCNFNTNKCVMYHAFQMVFDPCDRCAASIRARDLSAPPIGADGGY